MRLLEEEYKVGTWVMNLPCYHYRFIADMGYSGQDTPVADSVCYRLFCPAVHPLMSDEDMEYIAAAIAESVQRVKKS